MNEHDVTGRRQLLGAMALLPLAGCSQPASAQATLGDSPVSVRAWGALGQNDPADTERIQRALDEAPIGCDLIFPPGHYRIVRQLEVRRRVNIVGQGAAFFGDFGRDTNSDMFSINIADQENRDNRNQRIEGIRASFRSGGRNLILVRNDPPNAGNVGMLIQNNVLAVLPDSPGHCIRFDGIGNQHNTIRDCQIENSVYLACADGMTITGCLIFGRKTGIILDLLEGAFVTRILANTIVSGDGALHIRNASQVIFENNHIEQNLGYGRNQAPNGASVWIEPERYVSRLIHIAKNNFGAGTNLDTSIHINGACEDTYIDHNMFYFPGTGVDIRLMGPSVKWTRIGPNNVVRGPDLRRGFDPGNPVSIVDRGTGSYGVRKPASDLALRNGWTGALMFWKSLEELLCFEGRLIPGNAAPGTIVGRLPDGFRPRGDTAILCPTAAGPATLAIGADGVIRVVEARPGADLHLGGVQVACHGRSAAPSGA